MATYAIGDVHGQYDLLLRLLETFQFSPGVDRLWFTGDIVNRGPDSLAVCRFIRSLNDDAVVVLGNHDVHLLALSADLHSHWQKDALQPVLDASDRDEIFEWLRHRPLFHQENEAVMVHAGLLPQWDIPQAASLAREAEAAFRGENCRAFLAALYGNEPNRWEDSLVGMDRLRVIVNAFCRLRFCTEEGTMDFSASGPPDHPPAGYLPWFDIVTRRSRGHLLITGHWSALGLRVTADHIALDTGSCWGGALTAIRLEDRALFQASPTDLPRTVSVTK